MTRRISSPSSSSSSPPFLPPLFIDHTLSIIPNLPNDVALLILSFLPYCHLSRLKSTSKAWHIFLSSKTLISLRQRHRNPSNLFCVFPKDPFVASPCLFDPQTLAWCSLPPMPCNPHVYGLCNFSSIAVGPYLYVLGGSLFDTRSFPLDRPSPSSSAFRFDFAAWSWERISPMLSPRGSFACAAIPNSAHILVAGGGSRHHLFSAAGSRMGSVEMYDIYRDEWVALDGLPNFRAGCVGFFVKNGEDREFWVMGGYGESRTISRVFPVDEYYRDAVVMELNNVNDRGCGKWREVGDMWDVGQRMRLGKIVVVEDEDDGCPEVYMLDGNVILRYDMASNRWCGESHVPRNRACNFTFGFVVLGGELYVIASMRTLDPPKIQRLRQHRRPGTLYIQIYNPKRKTWRTLITKSPFYPYLDFNSTVICSIRL